MGSLAGWVIAASIIILLACIQPADAAEPLAPGARCTFTTQGADSRTYGVTVVSFLHDVYDGREVGVWVAREGDPRWMAFLTSRERLSGCRS